MAHSRIALIIIGVVLIAQTAMPPCCRGDEVKCTGKYKDGRKPTDDELKKILKKHDAWVEDGGPDHLEDSKVADDPRRANLCDAHLRAVHLEGAHLSGAHLEGVDLTGAYLPGIHLSDAHLENADLKGALLYLADLKRAHLEGADLTGAYGVTQEQINSAIGDATTKLPPEDAHYQSLVMPESWTKQVSMAQGNLPEALKAYRASGPTTHKQTKDVPSDTVLQTSSTAGGAVAKGTPISPSSASPVPAITVPNVVGLKSVNAISKLTSLGFALAPSISQASEKPANRVIEVSPEAGSQVPQGSTVRLTIAQPRPITVPNVMHLDVADATSELKTLHLHTRIIRQESRDKAGTVIKTSPPPGSQLSEGSRVKLTIAEPIKVQVPDVTNLRIEVAENILTAHSLKIGTITSQPTNDRSPNTVIRTSPLASAKVSIGEQVRLTVTVEAIEMTLPFMHCRQGAHVTLTGRGLANNGYVYLNGEIAPSLMWEPPTVRFVVPSSYTAGKVVKVEVRSGDQTKYLGNIVVDENHWWSFYNCR